MKVYEFSAKVTQEKNLTIPADYIQLIQAGSEVRVILLVDESVKTEQTQPLAHDDFISVQAIVREIQQTPQNPDSFQPASGLLAKHLSDSPEIPDFEFEVKAWNQSWDEVEAKMKILEQTEQSAETHSNQ